MPLVSRNIPRTLPLYTPHTPDPLLLPRCRHRTPHQNKIPPTEKKPSDQIPGSLPQLKLKVQADKDLFEKEFLARQATEPSRLKAGFSRTRDKPLVSAGGRGSLLPSSIPVCMKGKCR